MENNNTLKIDKILAALLLSLGIGLAGHFIGNAILKSRLLDRQVAVKGLSEREVTADCAFLKITAKSTGNSLIDCNNKIEADKTAIVNFLIKQGFEQGEICTGEYVVNDLLAQTYRNDGSQDFRYIIEASILLRTENVHLIQKVTQQQNLLAQQGIVFVNDGPYFEFTKFNDLKPEMLAEGIKNARKAAEKFAEDSGSKVGKLKKANQGTFTISSLEAAELTDSYRNNANALKSLYKKIRLVTTLEYFLENY